MRTAAFHTLGCKVNAYETEAMQQELEAAGFQIVDFGETADVYVINTCSVTNVADKKSRQMLHRARKKNPQAVVVAAGCYVQAAKEKLREDAGIDLIIGNNKKKDLAKILTEYLESREEKAEAPAWGPRAHVIDIARTGEYEELHIDRIADHTRAFIKVQDGCSQFCSYCIIPYTRGRIRSRRAEDVRKEIETLAKKGYREMVLTGIHLSSYGKDFSESEECRTLLDLIRLVHQIPGVERIRLGSLEPRIVTEEFAGALAALPKVCPHFHLSLQSGCEATLKRMNRHYTPGEYLRGCEILRKAFENPAITTDVIVGFPGETEEEFQETRAFLEQVRFYEMHIFKYSRRGGTRADRMPDQVPEEVKSRRSDALLELEGQMSLEYRKSFLGKECRILLEEIQEIGGAPYMVGHTEEYVRMAVPVEEAPERGTFFSGTAKKMLNPEVILLQEKLRI